MSSQYEELPEELTPKNTEVVTKYKTAGEIATRVLKAVIEAAVAGANVTSLCILGDSKIVEETNNIYKKPKDGVKIEKGIAFPTCISVNNCICHYSPLASDPAVILKDGDVVKIELGVHVDGFPAQIGHTIVVGATKENPAKGKVGDLLVGTYNAGQAAMRLVKSGKKNTDVSAILETIANTYNCNLVEGFTSHNVEKDLLDGDKVICLKATDNQRKEIKEVEFEDFEVYTVDVLMTTGEGKPRKLDTRTTVFKKNNATYMLKMKTSRILLNDITTKYGFMAFSLRGFEDENKTRMGIQECYNHGLVSPYDVLYEKDGDLVALYKFTIMLTPTGSLLITNPPFNGEVAKSEIKIADKAAKDVLNSSMKKSAAPAAVPAASTSK